MDSFLPEHSPTWHTVNQYFPPPHSPFITTCLFWDSHCPPAWTHLCSSSFTRTHVDFHFSVSQHELLFLLRHSLDFHIYQSSSIDFQIKWHIFHNRHCILSTVVPNVHPQSSFQYFAGYISLWLLLAYFLICKLVPVEWHYCSFYLYSQFPD